jgi:hypothetical protein
MNAFGSSTLRQAFTAAGMGAALMLSASVGHTQAQPGPFGALDGSWFGVGTISFVDGSTGEIRCKATYHTDDSGFALQSTLICASDRYKFDLASDMTSQGSRLSGDWSERVRNSTGKLTGAAGGGQIKEIVAAPAFTAAILLVTKGNKQSLSIQSPPGEIRGIAVSMVR